MTEKRSEAGSAGRWAWYAILSLSLATAIGTHFFGIVLAGAVLSTLAASSRGSSGQIGGLVAVSVVVGLAALADIPFAIASIGKSHGPSGFGFMTRLESVYKLLVELNDHPSLMIDGRVEGCLFLGLLILVVTTIQSDSGATRALALTLGAGLGAVALVQLAFGREGFNASSVNYNLWMKPGLCLIGVAGLASRSPVVRRSSLLGTSLIIAAQGVGVVQLACRGDHFAHGPHRAVASMIRGLEPTDLAVVHDDGSGHFVFVANPIRYEFGPDLEQFRLLDGTGGSCVVPMKAEPTPRPIADLPHRYLVVVRCSPTGDRKLVDQIRTGDRSIAPGPILVGGHAASGRRRIRHDLQVARISARIDVYERLAR